MLTHSISIIGNRPSNEDHHIIIENISGIDNDLHPYNFYGLFDGHGGKNISKHLKEKLPAYFLKKEVLQKPSKKTEYYGYIRKLYCYMQETIKKEIPSAKYSGSTALCNLFFKHNNYLNFYTINVGDCRAVLCNRYNIAIPLTKDHKPNMYDEKKRITKMGGEIVLDDGDWRIKDLSVSRAFGDLDCAPYVDPVPDIYKYEKQDFDKFIVMACDGLWDVLDNQEVVDFILDELDNMKGKIGNNKSMISKGNIAKNLAEHAIKKGSMDNITIIIIFFVNIIDK